MGSLLFFCKVSIFPGASKKIDPRRKRKGKSLKEKGFLIPVTPPQAQHQGGRKDQGKDLRHIHR